MVFKIGIENVYSSCRSACRMHLRHHRSSFLAPRSSSLLLAPSRSFSSSLLFLVFVFFLLFLLLVALRSSLLALGPWPLAPASWLLALGSWLLAPGSPLLASRSSLFAPRSSLLASRSSLAPADPCRLRRFRRLRRFGSGSGISGARRLGFGGGRILRQGPADPYRRDG